MARFLSRANIMCGGLLRPAGTVWEQDPTAEVSDLVGAELVVEALPDGSFPEPPPVPPIARCCGGGGPL